MKNLAKKVIYGLVLAVLVYIILAIWGAKNGLSSAISSFSWRLLPLLLFLALLNYLLRFIKWQYYLKILNIKIPASDSFIIFMSGLSLTITPGKLGEVVKSYFLKVGFNQSVARTAPIVLADRLSDFLSLILIASIGVIGFSYGQRVIWSIAIILIFIILAIMIKPFGQSLINILKKIKILHKRGESLQALYDSSYFLLSAKKMIFPLILSVIAWSFEALAFYFIFVNLKINSSALAAFFIYSFSTIIGAVSMLPGGLGATEGAITGLLKIVSVDSGVATLVTLIIRAVTLWFAVIIGMVFLLIAEKKYGGKINQKKSEQKSKTEEGKIQFLSHVHTKISDDGQLNYQEIINFCRSNQIAVVAVTDHNEICGAINLAKLAKGNPRVIIGEEIKTPDGEIIGLFLKQKIAKYTPLLLAISEIKKQGGLVYLPHGGDTFRRSAISRKISEKIINDVDIVEVFNSRSLLSNTDRFGQYLAEKFDKATIAGGDAHLKVELAKAINIIADFKNKEQFLESLHRTKFVAKKTNILIQVYSMILKKYKKD